MADLKSAIKTGKEARAKDFFADCLLGVIQRAADTPL